MEVIGLRPDTKEYVITATEGELNKIAGLTDVVDIAGRIKVGSVITISDMWTAAKDSQDKLAQMQGLVQTLRTNADQIETALSAKVEPIEPIKEIIP